MLGNRFQRSVAIAKQSYAVLKKNPTLAFFPVISGIAGIIVSIPFLIGIAVNMGLGHQTHQQAFGALHYLLIALMGFCNYFVIIFFNAALVACANENLQGRPTTVGFGIQAAVSRLPQIIGWAAIASTIGLVLRFIGERTGIIGEIVTGLIGFAWNLAVYFVVPVLVIDRESPIEAIKTSTGMIKATWGERLMLGIGIGTVMVLVGLVSIVPFALAIALLIQSLWMLSIFFCLVGVMIILVVSVVGSAMTSIYQTALYLYCRHGGAFGGFTTETLQAAFIPKPQRKMFGMRY